MVTEKGQWGNKSLEESGEKLKSENSWKRKFYESTSASSKIVQLEKK